MFAEASTAPPTLSSLLLQLLHLCCRAGFVQLKLGEAGELSATALAPRREHLARLLASASPH